VIQKVAVQKVSLAGLESIRPALDSFPNYNNTKKFNNNNTCLYSNNNNNDVHNSNSKSTMVMLKHSLGGVDRMPSVLGNACTGRLCMNAARNT
jgi:hypothetical protein